LRDAGCRILDLGALPTSFEDPHLIIPFQTAIRAIRTKNLFPTYTVLLDYNTTLSNSLEKVKWGRTFGIAAPCKIHRPFSEHSEKEVLRICRGLFNPTKLTNTELHGVQKTIETGRIELLEEDLPETGRIGELADST
jgi:hypothetical protein